MEPSKFGERSGLSPRRIALVGGGPQSAVGRAHLNALAIDGNWEVVAIAPSGRGATGRNEEWGNSLRLAPSFQSWQEMIGVKELRIDSVLVLVPSPLHFEVSEQVLTAGHHLIVEKPASTSTEQILLLQKAMLNDTSAHVIQNYTGFPAFRALKGYFDSGAIGELVGLRLQMLQHGFRRLSGGVLTKPQEWRRRDYEIPTVSLDLGIHLVQMANIITSHAPPEFFGVAAKNPSLGVVESVDLVGRYPAGATISLSYGKKYLGKENSLSIEVFGDNGALGWYLESPDHLVISDSRGRNSSISREIFEEDFPELKSFARFKSGHPTGFVEALANYYTMVLQDIRNEHNPLLSPTRLGDLPSSVSALERVNYL